ncbi:MAG: putative universal stress protein, partial [Candidatus Scalindua rubra]
PTLQRGNEGDFFFASFASLRWAELLQISVTLIKYLVKGVTMKFICEKCDIPFDFEMKENLSKESMKVTFCCTGCDARFSMVTNPGETHLLYSLGVNIGGKEKAGTSKITQTAPKGKEAEGEREETPIWTPEAEERLNNVPSFVRPMAKRSVEKLAKERGCRVIDAALMDEARDKFMGECKG